MNTYIVSVRNGGRITIPAEVRRSLGLQSGGKVLIVLDGDSVTIQRTPKYTLESGFGAVPALPNNDPRDFDDLIEEAMEEHADEVVAQMRQGVE